MRLNGNYYDILGVSPRASTAEITRSYRRLARQFHPDRTTYKETAHRVFVRISLAYQTLIDPESRARYDDQVLRRQDASSLDPASIANETSALEASPEAIKLWTASAYEAFSRGQISTALEQCQRVMRFVDDDWTVYALLGDIASGVGSSSRALGYYRDALTLQPDNRILEEKIRRLESADEAGCLHRAGGRASQRRSGRDTLGVKGRQRRAASLATPLAAPAAGRFEFEASGNEPT